MESTNQHPMGINRFECRACPYEHAVEVEYYERTEMKQKEVEDVIGGKEEFANADSVPSEFFVSLLVWFGDGSRADCAFFSPRSAMPCRGLQWGPCILLPAADSQCGRANDYVLEGR